VTPFARRIIEEQTNPTSLTKGFVSTLRKTMRAAQSLPDNINRSLKRVADGDLRMTVRPGGFDPLMARVEQALDRLAFALVVSAFVLGFSWLLAPRGIPFWLEVIAGFALVCAAGVGVWFFMSIVFRSWRQRKHDD
jgi:ubiquinone biosynthesis protein